MGRRKKPLRERDIEVLSAKVRFDIYKEVEKIARRDGLTMSQVMRKALVEYVDKNRQPQAAA